MWSTFIERKEFFLGLLWEHIEISLAAIVIAVLFGGLVGILISEFQKSAKPALGVINFLYTIPSISMLGFLSPLSGIGNATDLSICPKNDGICTPFSSGIAFTIKFGAFPI